jgi:dimeric dUTPase (all-alpha-NTP-PPase superfamily)
MNLNKLFELQRELDERIVKEKVLEGEELLPRKILALQVELGECANEWRGFKFWSKDQKARTEVLCDTCNGGYVCYPNIEHGMDIEKICGECNEGYNNPLLEEYIDCLHFFLSIGLDYGVDTKIDLKLGQSKDVMILFALVNRYVAEMWWEFNDSTGKAAVKWLFAMQHFLRLGEVLGFTWEQIEAAYMAKNAVNHNRQSTGY